MFHTLILFRRQRCQMLIIFDYDYDAISLMPPLSLISRFFFFFFFLVYAHARMLLPC